MTFSVSIDASLPTPPFRQLHDVIVQSIAAGGLKPGERLPTTRALAAELGLAVNTVASAYRALEEAGVVEGRGRAGTYVSLGQDPVTASAREIALEAAKRLRDLGLNTEAARKILADAVDASASSR